MGWRAGGGGEVGLERKGVLLYTFYQTISPGMCPLDTHVAVVATQSSDAPAPAARCCWLIG